MYYYTYDADNGKLTAFYNDEFHQYIPSGAVAISDAEWQELAANHAQWIVDVEQQQLIRIDDTEPEIELVRDWQALVSRLRGSVVFGKVYESAKADLFLNTAFTFLTTTLFSSSPDFNDFMFAIHDVVQIMAQRFTSEDIAFINDVLFKCGFADIQF
jgi:hypothetical protein